MKTKVLTPEPGLTTGVGYYLSGMEEVRGQLINAIKELDIEGLGRPAFAGSHSIGALVLHIGEAEWWWMQCNVAGQKLTEEDPLIPGGDVLDDPEEFITRGYTAAFCLDQIATIRNQTIKLLSTYTDDDLERIVIVDRDGEDYSYSLRWILHHLIDHEAHHKGQILMLKRLMVA